MSAVLGLLLWCGILLFIAFHRLIWELIESYVMWALMMIAVLLIFGIPMYTFIHFFAALFGH